MGSLHSPMICKCLLKVLCPVSRPITTLVCVLLKDNSRAPIAGSGPEINSRACLCVLQGPRHNARCYFSTQCFIFLLIFCLETPKKGSGPMNHWAEPSLASLSAISLPLTPARPGNFLVSTTWYQVEEINIHKLPEVPSKTAKWQHSRSFPCVGCVRGFNKNGFHVS